MTMVERPAVVIRADQVAGPGQGQWTYEKYAALPDNGQRYEIVNGVLYMIPAFPPAHQGVAVRIAYHLFPRIDLAGKGKLLFAPVDVQLREKTVVQPDAIVVLRPHLDRIKPTRIIGAPDLVIEITSPGTARHDLHEKLIAYTNARIPEYWVINPDARTIEVLTLNGDTYRPRGLFSGNVSLSSQVLPGLPIKAEQFFAGI